MDSGKIAAEVLVQGFEMGDLSKAFLKKYKNRCKEQFMRDFKYSGKIVKFMAKHPTFIDAFASVCKRKGAKFMLKWGKIMTGATPKSDLLKPSMVFPILWELIRLKILHKNPED